MSARPAYERAEVFLRAMEAGPDSTVAALSAVAQEAYTVVEDLIDVIDARDAKIARIIQERDALKEALRGVDECAMLKCPYERQVDALKAALTAKVEQWQSSEQAEAREAAQQRDRPPAPANLSYHTAQARRRLYAQHAAELAALLADGPGEKA